jgi:O-Antigen ligase
VTEHVNDDLPELDDMPIPGAGPVGYESTRDRSDDAEVDAAVLDAAVLDAAVLDAAVLDAPVLDAPVLDDSHEPLVVEPVPAPPRATFSEQLIATVVFFVPFAYYNLANASFTTLKASLVVTLVGPGLLALGRLLRARDGAARWGAAYLAATLVSTLLSGNIALSLSGPYYWLNGWILTLALVSVWALGRSLTDPGRHAVGTAVVLSATAMSILAVLGSRFNVWPTGLVYLDRAQSLTGNPVYLSTFLAGALAVALVRARDHRFFLASAFLIGAALEYAGGRAGVGAALVVVVVVTIVFKGRYLIASLLSIVGFVLAWVTGTGTSAAARVGTQAGGLGERPEQWRTVWSAFKERPILGWGMGRLDAATGPFRPLGYGPCRTDEALHDAHNVVLHHLGTVGVIGTVLMIGWLVTSARHTRGVGAIAAVAVGLNLMVEPLWGPSVVPIVLLVGAASTIKASTLIAAPAPGGVRRYDRPVLLAFLIAAMPALLILYSDIVVHKAASTAEAKPAELARKLTPDWPELEDIVLRSTILANEQQSLAVARESAWDVADDVTWMYRGNYELNFGSVEAARTAFLKALDRNPSSLKAMYALVKLSDKTGDSQTASTYRAMLRAADSKSCTPEQLAGLRPA